jgi:hypothetical protein
MEESEYLCPLRLREASHQPTANRSKRGGSSTAPHRYGCVPAIQRGAFRTYPICPMRHLDLSRPVHQWRFGSPLIFGLDRSSRASWRRRRRAYSSISGCPVISEMFHKLISHPEHAVTAGVMPPYAYPDGCRFPVVTPLYQWCESIDLGMRPVHPCRVESASIALDLPIADDLLQAACPRSMCLATPLSTDSML